MAEKWENSLLGARSLAEELEKEPELRHGLPFIKASDVGNQYYCEQKVKLRYEIGERVTKRIAEGRAMHSELTEGLEKISIDKFIKEVKTKDVCGLSGLPILTRVEGVPLAGRLDDVIFYKTKPILVADLKTTSRSSLWAGHDKPVQIRTYGLGLDCMGFDCSKLKLMIGVVHTDAWREFEEIEYNPYVNDITIIAQHLKKGFEIGEIMDKIENDEISLSPNGYRRWIKNYDRDRSLDDFKWASSYWLDERDAIPTKKPGKCKACVYREDCPESLA